jgi:Mg/Co/Ni transporter MgtE
MRGYFKAIRQRSKAKRQAEYDEFIKQLNAEMEAEIVEILTEEPEYKRYRLTPRLKKLMAERIIKEVIGKRL